MGAVAVSIRREKLDDTKDLKDQYQYRLIVRTSEVMHRSAECVCFVLGFLNDDTVMSHAEVNYLPAFIL